MQFSNKTQSHWWGNSFKLLYYPFLLVVCLSGYSLSGQFAFPQLTGFFPDEGEPGTIVTLTGSGFQSTVSVLFGVGSAQFEVVNDTQIRAVLPTDATTGPVTVNTSRGFAASHSFFQVAPRISAFEPVFGKEGDVIILRGANFSGLSEVWVGAHRANFLTAGETQLSFAVPLGASTGIIRIVSDAGEAASDGEFQVIGPEPFVLSFEPQMSPPGQLIVIRGVQLSNASEVLFAGDKVGVFSVVADTQIIVRVPADADSGPVKITTPAGQSESSMDFLVIGTGPFITGLNPPQGQAGDTIIVEGVNLTNIEEIFLNDEEVNFQVVADTQLSFTIPVDATSGFIRLVTSSDEYTSDIELSVIGPEPVIDSFSPMAGQSGTRVQFQGLHFSHVESVLFGDVEALFEVAAETQMTALVPLDAVTGHITIKTAFGETVSENEFVVQDPAPEILSFSPSFGSVGTQVTLNGSYFNGATNVYFGDEEATFQIVADSQILTNVPDDAITGSIRVESPSGAVETTTLFYLPAKIDSFEPEKATPGTELMILGSNFTGTSRIRIGGKEAVIQSVGMNEITTIVPSDALIGTLSITTPAGSLATEQSFGVLPLIQEINPLAGPIGTTIQVKGAGFSEVQTVLIGELIVAFSIESHDLIEIVVPSNTPSGQITLVNSAGLAISTESFQLRTAADLSLEVMPLASPSTWQIPNAFTIKVHNAGPSSVQNFFVKHTLPLGSELIMNSNPNGGTDGFGTLITSGIVSLGAGETAQIIHTVSTPHFGYESHLFQIDTEIFDPTPEDHRVELNQPITGPDVQLEIIQLDEGKHRLSWHPNLRGFELLSRSAFSENDPWVTLVSPLPVSDSFLEFENDESTVYYIIEPAGSL